MEKNTQSHYGTVAGFIVSAEQGFVDNAEALISYMTKKQLHMMKIATIDIGVAKCVEIVD